MEHEKSLEERERASKSLTQQLEKEKSNGESLSQQLGNVISELSSLKQQFKSEEKHLNDQVLWRVLLGRNSCGSYRLNFDAPVFRFSMKLGKLD